MPSSRRGPSAGRPRRRSPRCRGRASANCCASASIDPTVIESPTMATESIGIAGTVGGAVVRATGRPSSTCGAHRRIAVGRARGQQQHGSRRLDEPDPTSWPASLHAFGRDRGGRAGARRAPGARERHRRRSRRPCTIVSRADAGPQRSHASIGSAIAPAKRGPSSDHTATSPTAPGDEHAELAGPAEARRPAERRHLERRARGRRAGAVAQLGQQHRLARLEPQRRGVGRRRAVDAEPDGDAGGAQVDDRGDARRQDQVARRAVGDADAGRRRAGRPRRRRACTQWASHARSVSQPVRSR